MNQMEPLGGSWVDPGWILDSQGGFDGALVWTRWNPWVDQRKIIFMINIITS